MIEEHKYFPRRPTSSSSWSSTSTTPRCACGSAAWGRRGPAAPAPPPRPSRWCAPARAQSPVTVELPGRQARGGGQAGLARLHDRSGRGDLPRRPLARVPRAPRVTRSARRHHATLRRTMRFSQTRSEPAARTCSPRSSARSPRARPPASTSSASASATPTCRRRRTSSTALREAAADPATHQYPSNRGSSASGEAVAGYYSRALRRRSRRRHRDRARCSAPRRASPTSATPARPAGRVPGRRPRLSRLHDRPACWPTARPCTCRCVPELGFQPDLDAIEPSAARQGQDDLRQLPEQPDRRRHRGRLLRPSRRLRQASTTSSWSTTTPTPTSPTTATWRRASCRRRAPRRSASSCSRSRRATT